MTDKEDKKTQLLGHCKVPSKSGIPIQLVMYDDGSQFFVCLNGVNEKQEPVNTLCSYFPYDGDQARGIAMQHVFDHFAARIRRAAS